MKMKRAGRILAVLLAVCLIAGEFHADAYAGTLSQNESNAGAAEISVNGASGNKVSGDTASENRVSENSASKNSASKNSASGNTASGNIIPAYTVSSALAAGGAVPSGFRKLSANDINAYIPDDITTIYPYIYGAEYSVSATVKSGVSASENLAQYDLLSVSVNKPLSEYFDVNTTSGNSQFTFVPKYKADGSGLKIDDFDGTFAGTVISADLLTTSGNKITVLLGKYDIAVDRTAPSVAFKGYYTLNTFYSKGPEQNQTYKRGGRIVSDNIIRHVYINKNTKAYDGRLLKVVGDSDFSVGGGNTLQYSGSARSGKVNVTCLMELQGSGYNGVYSVTIPVKFQYKAPDIAVNCNMGSFAGEVYLLQDIYSKTNNTIYLDSVSEAYAEGNENVSSAIDGRKSEYDRDLKKYTRYVQLFAKGTSFPKKMSYNLKVYFKNSPNTVTVKVNMTSKNYRLSYFTFSNITNRRITTLKLDPTVNGSYYEKVSVAAYANYNRYLKTVDRVTAQASDASIKVDPASQSMVENKSYRNYHSFDISAPGAAAGNYSVTFSYYQGSTLLKTVVLKVTVNTRTFKVRNTTEVIDMTKDFNNGWYDASKGRYFGYVTGQKDYFRPSLVNATPVTCLNNSDLNKPADTKNYVKSNDPDYNVYVGYDYSMKQVVSVYPKSSLLSRVNQGDRKTVTLTWYDNAGLKAVQTVNIIYAKTSPKIFVNPRIVMKKSQFEAGTGANLLLFTAFRSRTEGLKANSKRFEGEYITAASCDDFNIKRISNGSFYIFFKSAPAFTKKKAKIKATVQCLGDRQYNVSTTVYAAP